MKKASEPAAPPPDFFSVDEIGEISEGLFGSERAAQRLRMLRLDSAWARAVGPRLRAVARPSTFHARSLTVDVRDAAWKRELDRLKPEILSRLARLLTSHPIADINFRVRKVAGRDDTAWPATARTREAASEQRLDPSADLEVEMSAPLQRVPDPGLRDRLSRVMGRYLARAR